MFFFEFWYWSLVRREIYFDMITKLRQGHYRREWQEALGLLALSLSVRH